MMFGLLPTIDLSSLGRLLEAVTGRGAEKPHVREDVHLKFVTEILDTL
jgi:hypothetical protein